MTEQLCRYDNWPRDCYQFSLEVGNWNRSVRVDVIFIMKWPGMWNETQFSLFWLERVLCALFTFPGLVGQMPYCYCSISARIYPKFQSLSLPLFVYLEVKDLLLAAVIFRVRNAHSINCCDLFTR